MTNQQLASKLASDNASPTKTLKTANQTIFAEPQTATLTTVFSYGHHHKIATLDYTNKTALINKTKASRTTSKQTNLFIKTLTANDWKLYDLDQYNSYKLS